ncbi:MAG TPA: hypothetical protein VFV08_10430, partial [Puia sp.]|nr:hypothetical protein [Puia sp.]
MEPKEERLDKKIIPTEHIDITLFAENDIEVDVLRLDLIDPVISGNKWFKLKNYFAIARNKKLKTILTFGGPYSNHIVATACAAYKSGIHSIGMIRGEQPLHWSHTLKTAAEFGMVFNFLSRSEYKTLSQEQSGPEMTKRYPGACIIPEGGAGKPGIEGSADILKYSESRLYNEI